MERVVLTDRDIRQALQNAGDRRLEWLREGRPERYETGAATAVGRDFLGCLGEWGLAKWLGVFPGGFSAAGAGDVGRCEVRAIEGREHSLFAYPNDADDRAIVLALVGNPYWSGVCLLGWIPAVQAKQPVYWDATLKAPAWRVPQSALWPMGDLVAWLEGRSVGVESF